jgi:hypothetical protein
MFWMHRAVLPAAVFLAAVPMMPAGAELPRHTLAPAFVLRQIDGPVLSLAALRGKVVFLDFWGPG